MSDPVSAARSARENLRQGLAALQAPGIPPTVTQAAEPVAQAMGALHQIEASGGAAVAQHAPVALEAVRRALGLLQAQPPGIPAVNQALEAVAGSLSVLHQLSQTVVGNAATQMQQPSPVAHTAPQPVAPMQAQPAPNQGWGGTHVMQPTGAQPAVAPMQQPPPAQYPPQQAYAQPAVPQQAYPQQAYTQPAAPQQAYPQQAYPQQAYPQQAAPQPTVPQQAAPQQPYAQPAPHQQAYPPQQPAPAAQVPAPQPGYRLPPGQWQPPQAQAAPAPQAAQAARPAGTGASLTFDAELGAHSTTNFYKGLSGNDVIDSGGIFIATYQIPEIGQPVVIKVSLPGGYEFEAAGVVRWTRDAPHSTRGVESPPGFGAQFTNISQEGRQLVYRYVRNREPLFHDDL